MFPTLKNNFIIWIKKCKNLFNIIHLNYRYLN